MHYFVLCVSGIGILSKFPIIRHEVQNLTYRSGPDTNRRIALHAKILLEPSEHAHSQKFIHVTAVHFSYDKHQQCSNTLDLLNYLQGGVVWGGA